LAALLKPRIREMLQPIQQRKFRILMLAAASMTSNAQPPAAAPGLTLTMTGPVTGANKVLLDSPVDNNNYKKNSSKNDL
jgi:hypothetical protein